MPTCKNCVHVEVCRDFVLSIMSDEEEKQEARKNLSLLENKMNVDECSFFKDRSKFIELPCKLGDKVFYFDTAGGIYEQAIFQSIYGGTGLKLDFDVMFDSELIGKKFFLSREEAERELKGNNNEKNN